MSRPPAPPNELSDTDAPAKPTGRPSIYTEAILAEIVERLSLGEPLAQICRDDGMPAYRTVWEWQQKDEAVSKAIAHAREEGEDVIAANCLEIADDATNDWMERRSEEEQGNGWRLNGEHVQRSKLRIETRLKLLAKWNPKKYGDKLQTEHSGTLSVLTKEQRDATFAAALSADT